MIGVENKVTWLVEGKGNNVHLIIDGPVQYSRSVRNSQLHELMLDLTDLGIDPGLARQIGDDLIHVAAQAELRADKKWDLIYEVIGIVSAVALCSFLIWLILFWIDC